MTIRDLMELFISDQELKIYDLDNDEFVFDGLFSDLEDEHEKLADTEITSIDNIGVGYGNTTVVININSEN